jgi:hypothetical protein
VQLTRRELLEMAAPFTVAPVAKGPAKAGPAAFSETYAPMQLANTPAT